MEVFIKGKGPVQLTQSEFRAQGGEGSVYVKGATAYKIYADPQKMIPLGKIAELARLTLPDIITPGDVLLNKKNLPVGYAMRALPDTVPLCALFPKAYRDRVGLTGDHVLKLVQALRDGVQHCHERQTLVVDLNEMNFLVDKAHAQLYFIDVDSYQTPSFAATALMDSVRDRHAQDFGTGTDWFAWGIVSFQMWIGLHPYKGKHPVLKTLDERMQANVSVFHKDVGIPAAALPLSTIPQAYRDWYEAVFERGLRDAPPSGPTSIIVVSPQTLPAVVSQKFRVDTALVTDGTIRYAEGGIVVTQNSAYVGGRPYPLPSGTVAVAVTPKLGRLLAARIENGNLRVSDLTLKADLALNLAAQDILTTGGRLYVRQGDGLFEAEPVELPTATLLSVRRVGNVLPQATQLFEGLALQNLLGAYYASLLPRAGACFQVRLPELDNRRIVDARFESGVLVVLAEQGGVYDRFVFRFASDYATHDARLTPDVGSNAALNFTVLETGVTLLMNEADEIEIFASAPGTTTVKRVQDNTIQSDCRLFHDGAQALFARGDTLHRFTMRAP